MGQRCQAQGRAPHALMSGREAGNRGDQGLQMFEARWPFRARGLARTIRAPRPLESAVRVPQSTARRAAPGIRIE